MLPSTGDRASKVSTLSIVIPAYNEEATLAATVEECRRVFADDERLAEIMIVDDVSTDGTRDLARTLADQDPRVHVLANHAQMGCVPTVLHGFREAQADYVFFLPADGQVPATAARACLDVAERGADVVTTRRATREDPWYRLVLAGCYNRFIRLVAHDFPASDVDSSSLFRRSTIQGLPVLNGTDAFALVELLLVARRRGARFAEIEIPHLPRAGGQSTGLRVREILAGARGIARLMRWRAGHGARGMT